MSADLQQSSTADFDAILDALHRAQSHLPESAIRDARQYRDEMIPRLIGATEDATAQVLRGEELESNGAFYAFFLLAEFRAHEALPTVLAALRLPGEGPFEMFGDAVTEYLPQVLLSLSASRDVIESLIADDRVNEYVRWNAMSCYKYLARDGLMTREEAVDLLTRHLRVAIADANEESSFASSLVVELCDYAAAESMDEIRSAFDRGLVDPNFARRDWAEERIAAGDSAYMESLARLSASTINDSIELLAPWFRRPNGDQPDLDDDEAEWEDDDGEYDEEFYDEDSEPSITIRNDSPRVGRNEACPCGSGKKFKKCCGAS